MEEKSTLSNFVTTYGTLILAIIGILQVWLIGLYKYFQIGKLLIFRSGKLEVSYSTFGPSLALNGTLKASRKDIFVSDMSIDIEKQRDRATHSFPWVALRSRQLRIAQTDPISLEVPSGFIVKVDQPHRFHIFFADVATQSEFTESLIKVLNDWKEYLQNKSEAIQKLMKENSLTYDIISEHIYNNDFIKSSNSWQKAWELIDRKNYWEEGDYRLKFTVKTADPNKTFSKSWGFTLDKTSFENLRLNSIATLRELCLRKADYFFAYVDQYDIT